ncbi:molybdopterin-binding/glycosyltransferase family 2 protein [Roseibium algae]|uniref:Molybdopterin-binding/glycosyltransferase family 2 protein n=1 Tax=Roseibium algae TaxID=3123038 RepID=A0ABU8TLZ7_9HYPH
MLKKGRVLTEDDLQRLISAGLQYVAVARLHPNDVTENMAAERIASAAGGSGLSCDAAFTGRVNLHADASGLFLVDKNAIDTMNRIDPSITIATLPAFEKVATGRMVATAKIIPFAVDDNLVSQAEQSVRDSLRIAPFRRQKIGLIATVLDHLKPSTMDKTLRVLEHRLNASGSTIMAEKRVAHDVNAVATAITEFRSDGVDMVIIFGASAVVDRQDILPEAIEKAGGSITYFGMPVDPGNLLLLADYDGMPILGAPGCARSPKENGFDWILDRLLADVTVLPEDISGLGVGGLLMEIGSRPQPREQTQHSRKPRIAAIILAAGKSSRMGKENKLLEHVDHQPLVAHAAHAAKSSRADEIVIVTGHMAEEVTACLKPVSATIVHNPDFADGMAGSIRTGLSALGPDIDGAIIMLGDMPKITGAILDNLIQIYSSASDAFIVAARANGKRGNPVLWDRRFFPELMKLQGDTGARHLIADNAHMLHELEIGDAARIDLDTPEALATYRQQTSTVN